jgi:hypothetical protein
VRQSVASASSQRNSADAQPHAAPMTAPRPTH